MSRILTTLDLPESALGTLAEVGPVRGPDGWEEGLAEAEALIPLLTTRVDEALLARAPALRVVATPSVGYDHIDVAACRSRGIVVTNTPDVLTDATADLAWALVLSAVRGLSAAERALRAGRFTGWKYWEHIGGDLNGRTLGILGMGRIGQAVARRAAPFGMRVIYHNRSRVAPTVEAETGARFVDWETLLAESDVLTLHAPQTPETRHLLNAETLRRMKAASYLVNTARGPLVDEGALVEALRSGHLAGAGLDVYEREPEIHPGLLELDNVTLLPHVGSATRDTRNGMVELAAENIREVLLGRPPVTPVP